MKAKVSKTYLVFIAVLTAIAATVALTSCQTGGESSSQRTTAAASAATQDEAAAATLPEGSGSAKLTESDIAIQETIENAEDGGHAIVADGETLSYANVRVNKTGEADGDEADFYGENAAVFATNGGTLTLKDMVVKTDGTHANAVFSYGEGTTVNIANAYIETSGNCSGGLMTTGGGTMNAENLTINTSGNSSAAIRSDRGGGTVNVTGGNYTTSGTGSPVIYSTADITVSDATMTSTASQGVVVEGKNAVTLNNVNLTADNNKKNSDKSSWYQAVMIYQSMSGDAAEGASRFAMNGGTLTNQNGDVFFINNTATEITLNNAQITNNGTLNASNQIINGDMIVDSVSHLNLYLSNNASFTGAINSSGQDGEVYVEIEDGSIWTLTGDSYITGMTCGANAINLNGHKLFIDGTSYTEGSASFGDPIAVQSTGNGHGGGNPPAKPEND